MRQLDWLETLVKGFAGLFLFLVFAMVTAQVASRYLLDFSLAAASELSIYCMIWSVFLGAAVAFRSNSHIAMDIVRAKLPARLARVATLITFVLLAGFLILLIFQGYDLAQRAMRQLSSASGLPVGYVSMAIPVGSVLAMVFLIESTVQTLRQEQDHD